MSTQIAVATTAKRAVTWFMTWFRVLAVGSGGAGTSAATRDDFTPFVRSRASPQRILPPPAHVLGSNHLLNHPLTGATAKMIKEATQNATEVLSQPTKWLGMYSEFITKNSSAVSQIESALRSLTYIIPGRSWHFFGTLPVLTCIRTVSRIGDSLRDAYALRPSMIKTTH